MISPLGCISIATFTIFRRVTPWIVRSPAIIITKPSALASTSERLRDSKMDDGWETCDIEDAIAQHHPLHVGNILRWLIAPSDPDHPGIAAIYGIEEAEGSRALALELAHVFRITAHCDPRRSSNGKW